MHRLRVLVVCCSLFLGSVPIAAQTKVALTDEERERLNAKLVEKKVLAMLDEVVRSAPSFRLPENRVWLLAAAADLMWPHDQKRASALFDEAIKSFNSIIAEDDTELDSSPSPKLYDLRRLRSEIIPLLANRDPERASNFLIATRAATADSTMDSAAADSDLEMTLAQTVAARNPGLALKHAEEMLERGRPLSLVCGVLDALSKVDLERAQKLAGLLAEKLIATKSTQIELIVSSRLVGLAAEKSSESSSQGASKQLLTSAQARALIEAMVFRVVSKSPGDRLVSEHPTAPLLLSQLKRLEKYVEKHAPSSLIVLKRIWVENEQAMSQSDRDWQTLKDLRTRGEVAPMLSAATQSTSVEMRQAFYVAAAGLASEQGHEERAREIIEERVDKNHREAVQQGFDEQRVRNKIKEGRFEEALQLISPRSSKAMRVNLMVEIARAAASSSRHGELAGKILAEAWAIAGGPVKTTAQLDLQLGISEAYLPVAPKRTFEIIEGTIESYNELFAAAAVLLSFGSEKYRDRELVMCTGLDHDAEERLAAILVDLFSIDADRVDKILGSLRYPDQRAAMQIEMLKRILGED